MATFSSFDEQYKAELQTHLTKNIDLVEEKVKETKEADGADEAERLLDQACDYFTQNVKDKMEEIKTSVKQKGTTCTSTEDNRKYRLFVHGVAAGISSTEGLLDGIFERIRNIVKTVIEWIRKGSAWMSQAITDAFITIRSYFNN